MINQRRAEWVVWKPMLDGSNLDEIDVFRLEYHLNDYSRPLVRRVVLVAIFISAVILIVPTLVTLLAVFGRILGID